MKDIRNDIRERLADASRRRETVMELVKAVDVEVETLKRMMDIENQRQQYASGSFSLTSGLNRRSLASTSSVPSFIEEALRDGLLSKDELKDVGVQRGVLDSETAGRTLHITLVNLVRGNRIRELPDGRYGLPERESPRPSDPPGAS